MNIKVKIKKVVSHISEPKYSFQCVHFKESIREFHPDFECIIKGKGVTVKSIYSPQVMIDDAMDTIDIYLPGHTKSKDKVIAYFRADKDTLYAIIEAIKRFNRVSLST